MLKSTLARPMCCCFLIVLSSFGAGYAAETIGGQITAAGSGTPLSGIDLDVFDTLGHSVTIQNGVSDPAGDYTLTLPGPGTYTIRADASIAEGFADQYHDHVFLPSLATSIVVSPGQAVTGIDFALALGVEVRGAVRSSATGLPLGSIDMDLFSLNGELLGGYPATTAVDGSYVVGALPPGQYYLRADPDPALGQFYMRTYYGGQHTLADATLITVVSTDVTGIDIALLPGGTIAGTITEVGSGTPLAGIDLDLYDSTGVRMPQGASTDLFGNYEVGPVPPGNYTLRADPTIAQGYLRTYYNGVYLPSLAATITVAEGAITSGINFALSPGGSISGTITEVGSGLPLAGIDLDCYDSLGQRVPVNAASDGLGAFQIGPVVPGSYFLRADPTPLQGYARQYYNGEISLGVADAIAVTAHVDTPGIDFLLDTAGAISGRVTDGGSGAGVANIDMDILQAGTFVHLEQDATTDANGDYSLTGLPPGSYVVRADPSQAQLYPRTYYGGVPVRESATPIPVMAGENVAGIDIQFQPGLPVTGVTGMGLLGCLIAIRGALSIMCKKKTAPRND